MVRRLGRRWSQLHRLVYAVAIVAVLHYWWHKSGKSDYAEVAWYACAVALLLGWATWRLLLLSWTTWRLLLASWRLLAS